ncbi:MAG: Trk system potassium transporter TrkA [Bacteroidales bacterium]|nr:Trk system potassium transporter TrkA [Bacteroidales bacterium]
MKIVIEGAGEVGSHLAKMLRAEANDVTVIDNDAKRLAAMSEYTDVEVISGNPSSIDVLRNANVGAADLYIAVYPFVTQEVNIVGALLAKQLGAAKVVARVNDESYLSSENKLIFKELGIELLFFPEKSAADEIVSYLKHSSTEETMDFARGKLQIAVFKLDEDSPIIDLRLGDFIERLDEQKRQQFRIIAISRDSKTIIPKLDTKFYFGDLVFTITKREGVPALYECFGKTNTAVNSVFILGGGEIASMLARTLDRQGVRVKIIEKEKDRCIELSESLPENVIIVNGDGRDPDVLCDEGISTYDSFVALTGNDEANVLACVVAKKLGAGRTVAEVENIDYIRLAEEMGVDTVINKKLITAGRIFKFTLSGRARFVRYMTGTNAEVVEYTVAPNATITKGALKDLDFPANAIIAGVIRGSEVLIAVGDTVIEPYDRVAIFTLPESISEIDKFFK